MATALAIPQSSESGRISQLLPTVKCSSCNEPVRLAELGDHICSTSSPSSKLASKISRMMSPGPRSNSRSTTRTSFSTTRTRSASSSYGDFPLAIPPVSSPPLLPKTAPPSQTTHHIPPLARERDHSNPSRLPPPSRTPPHTRPMQPPPSRSTTPVSIPLPSSPVPFSRVGTPQFISQHPHSDPRISSTPYLISTHSPRPLPYSSPAPINLPPTPTTPHFSQPAPSHHPDSPSFPGSPLPLSPPPHHLPGDAHRPQQAPFGPFGHNPTNSMFSTHGGITRSPEPDTKTGGEAGMAGVGRRGFAAVAGPASFLVPRAQGHHAGGLPLSPTQPYPGGNRPQFLDIAAANRSEFTHSFVMLLIVHTLFHYYAHCTHLSHL
ncbi:hypothetical protein L218DRAFT_143978 [Marasmius fiardii PR-910]|nr:hypothetical protein L218DRAFT_143978 [Marasmius fiardii PR-910]